MEVVPYAFPVNATQIMSCVEEVFVRSYMDVGAVGCKCGVQGRGTRLFKRRFLDDPEDDSSVVVL